MNNSKRVFLIKMAIPSLVFVGTFLLFFLIKNNSFVSSNWFLNVSNSLQDAKELLHLNIFSISSSVQYSTLKSLTNGYLSIPFLPFVFIKSTSLYIGIISSLKITITTSLFSLFVTTKQFKARKLFVCYFCLFLIEFFLLLSYGFEYFDILYIVLSLFLVFKTRTIKKFKLLLSLLLVYYLFFNFSCMFVLLVVFAIITVLMSIIDLKSCKSVFSTFKIYNVVIYFSLFLVCSLPFILVLINANLSFQYPISYLFFQMPNIMFGDIKQGIPPFIFLALPMSFIPFFLSNFSIKRLIVTILFSTLLIASIFIYRINHFFDFAYGSQGYNYSYLFLFFLLILIYLMELDFLPFSIKRSTIFSLIILCFILFTGCFVFVFSNYRVITKVIFLFAGSLATMGIIIYCVGIKKTTIDLHLLKCIPGLVMAFLPLVIIVSSTSNSMIRLSESSIYSHYDNYDNSSYRTIIDESIDYKDLISSNKSNIINSHKNKKIDNYLRGFGIDTNSGAYSTETILSLLNVKYYVAKNNNVEYFELVSNEKGIYYSSNNNVFPFSFFASSNLKTFNSGEHASNPFEFQNELMSSVSSLDTKIFTKILQSNGETETISFESNQKNIYFTIVADSFSVFDVSINNELFSYKSAVSGAIYKLPIFESGRYALTFNNLKKTAICYIYYEDIGTLSQHRQAIPGDDKFVVKKTSSFSLESISIDSKYDGTWYVPEFDCAVISLFDDGNYSIVHSKKTIKPLTTFGLVSFEFQPGVNKTKINYALPGGQMAVNVSFIGIGSLVFVVCAKFLLERRRNEF